MQVRFSHLKFLFLFLISVSVAFAAESAPVVFTAAKQFYSEAWIRGAERFPAGANLQIRGSRGQRALLPSFAASADANISFDGTHILFSGKRHAADRWQIWEAAVDGSAPRQITHCKDACVRPFYLPGGQIVFAERKAGRFVIETSALNVAEANGASSPSSGQTNAVPLTFFPGSALPTDVLRDGRVLFEAAYPLGPGAKAELYTVYTDGSGVEAYRCDHGADRNSGKQNASGDIVFTSANSLSRFTSPLAHADPIITPKGQFAGDVVEFSTGEWLVTWRGSAAQPFRLMQWKPGAPALEPFAQEAATNLLQPTLIAARPVPNRHPSGLHDWNGANLLCLNAYTSKYPFDTGSVATVKLYTLAASGQPKLMGSSPVESDGSFFLHVPADQPIKLELLDASGKTLQKESGWFWMRRGEQRACVGCHAGPERAPDNEVPKVLVKSTDPVDLTLEPAHTTRTGGR